MALLLIVARLLIDSGTENVSHLYVLTNEVIYEGRVLDWGYAERSISVPVSLPRVSDCRFRMADTDRRWRILLEQQTPRRRRIQLVRIHDELSPPIERMIGTFEIVEAVFPQDEVHIYGKDLTFAWLDKPVVQNLITRRNFPDLAEGIDEAFLHIVAGENRSEAENPQGVIPLPHMGMMSSIPETSPPTLVDRYGMAAHPISTFNAPVIYRLEPGDGLFTVVPDTEYTITQDLTPRTIDGVDYFFTFVDFDIQQLDGTKIQADFDGYFFRGVFENDDYTMPEVSSATGPLRNPVDFLINVLYVIIKNDIELSRFDIESFDRVREILEGEGSPPVNPYYCDGAITAPITARSFLQQFLTNFEIDLFLNKDGKIEINLTTATDADIPLFNDTEDIVRGTLEWITARPTFNRWRYRYNKNFATNEYAGEAVFDNEADQLALELPDASPPVLHIEEEIVEFPFVRDANTALLVIGRRASFLALGSYRVSFSLPMPEVYNDLELSHQFALTTVFGPGPNGWVNEAFKVTDIVHRFAVRTTDVKAIIRTPVTVLPQNDCPGITGPAVLDFGDAEVFNNVTDFQMPSYVAYVASDYPGQTSVRFRATVVKSVDGITTAVKLIDQLGAVKHTATLSYSFVPATGNYQAEVDELVTTLDATTEKLYLSLTKASASGVLQVLVPRLWVFLTESDQGRFSIPLLPGTSFDRDGSYLRTGLTYARMTSSSIESARFLKTAEAFSEVDSWTLRLVAGKSTGAGTVAFMNVETGLPVAEIEIAAGDGVNNAEYSTQISDTATNFTAGNNFEYQAKKSGATNVNIVHGWADPKIGSGSEGFFTAANLCAESAENYIRTDVSNCQDILMNRAYTYNVADWPASAIVYFEATGSSTEFGTATIHLLDTGTAASPTNPPTNVTSVTFPGATSRQRSGSVTLTELHIYTAGPSADPLFDIPAFLLFTISGP